jgi:hypothetical protein
MKNLFLTGLLFFTVLTASFAQKKCKPNNTVTDEFTEVTTVYWGGSLTSMGYYSFDVEYNPYLNIFNRDGQSFASIGIKVKGKLSDDLLVNKHTWVEKGSKILIKLENELITLISEDDGVVRNSGANTMLYMVCPISKEQIKKMVDQRMLKGKIHPFKDSADMFFQFSISKGRDKALSKQFNCFLITENK